MDGNKTEILQVNKYLHSHTSHPSSSTPLSNQTTTTTTTKNNKNNNEEQQKQQQRRTTKTTTKNNNKLLQHCAKLLTHTNGNENESNMSHSAVGI